MTFKEAIVKDYSLFNFLITLMQKPNYKLAN